jgi:hypothetical protein
VVEGEDEAMKMHGTSSMATLVAATQASRRAGIRVLAMLLLFVTGAAQQAGAAAIVIGPRIDLSPTTFALSIDIIDGIDVQGWQFDLRYDASDLQVNTGCDPFGGNPYCSLLTGPVTEGDFFASGAPFNVLLPGFIDLDPTTLAQTGLLFGVNGTFGGFPPLPSGNGTLAFVEFTILGDGGSAVTVDGSVVSTVPEPGTLALFAFGLIVPACRVLKRTRRRYAPVLLALMALTLSAGAAEAQTTAVGPYYATPSWDQTLSCTTLSSCPRFIVLSNFANAAVLDRETGLVWERSPSTEPETWRTALVRCNETLTLGGRLGWRLPTVNELASLVDPGQADPALPAGHPFTNVQLSLPYWSATTDGRVPDNKWFVGFFNDGDVGNGRSRLDPSFVWCVRGGQGVDPQ